MADDDTPKPPPTKRVPRTMATVTPLKKPTKTARGQTRRRQQGGSPLDPANIAIAERRSRALNLRRAGLTFQQCFDRLAASAARGDIAPLPKSYDRRAVQADIQHLLDDLTVVPAESLLAEEMDRLSAMGTVVWSKIMANDAQSLSAVDRMLKIMDRRAKYVGLDAPTRLVGADGGPIQIMPIPDNPAEVHDLLAERLDRLLPKEEPPAITGEPG